MEVLLERVKRLHCYDGQAFAGIVVTGTGFAGHERKSLRTLCTKTGIQYCGDLVSGWTTHLVVNHRGATSNKLHVAAQWGLPRVTLPWLLDSICQGEPLPETDYLVANPAPQQAAAAAVPNKRAPIPESQPAKVSSQQGSNSPKLHKTPLSAIENVAASLQKLTVTPKPAPRQYQPRSPINALDLSSHGTPGETPRHASPHKNLSHPLEIIPGSPVDPEVTPPLSDCSSRRCSPNQGEPSNGPQCQSQIAPDYSRAASQYDPLSVPPPQSPQWWDDEDDTWIPCTQPQELTPIPLERNTPPPPSSGPSSIPSTPIELEMAHNTPVELYQCTPLTNNYNSTTPATAIPRTCATAPGFDNHDITPQLNTSTYTPGTAIPGTICTAEVQESPPNIDRSTDPNTTPCDIPRPTLTTSHVTESPQTTEDSSEYNTTTPGSSGRGISRRSMSNGDPYPYHGIGNTPNRPLGGSLGSFPSPPTEQILYKHDEGEEPTPTSSECSNISPMVVARARAPLPPLPPLPSLQPEPLDDTVPIKRMQRAPRGSTVKARYRLPNLKAVSFAEEVHLRKRQLTLSVKDKQRAIVLTGDEDTEGMLLADPLSFYRAVGEDWQMEYHRLYTGPQALAMTEAPGVRLRLPPGFDASVELFRSTVRDHVDMRRVEGTVSVRKVKLGVQALRVRNTDGPAFYWRCEIDPQGPQVIMPHDK